MTRKQDENKMKTVYVLVDNTQHEAKVVGAYTKKAAAEDARIHYCDSQGLALDDDRCERIYYRMTALAS